MLSVYRESLYDLPQMADDLEKIRKIAQRTRGERYKAINEKRNLADSIQLKIDGLQKELERTKQEADRLRNDDESRKLMGLLEYIEPQATKIQMHHKKERYLSKWIQGQDTSNLLPQEPKLKKPIDCCQNTVVYYGKESE
ncbi:MAG: hypothetical protein MJA31_07325 [Clostridia bacterium]|nr:hypothetical protein [Clostridia bacterium]